MDENKLKEMNLERLRNYSNALYQVIFERYRVLPLISTLSSALVGLTIQNSELIKVQFLAFISFVTFLILIPLSVYATLYQLGKDTEHLSNKIENVCQRTENQTKNTNFVGIIFFFFWIAIVLFILSLFDLRYN